MRSKTLISSIIVLLLAASCQEKTSIDNNGLSLKTEEGEYTAYIQWLKVTADGDWTLSVLSNEDETVDWARVAQSSGSGSLNILFSYDANEGDYPRSCSIEMQLGGKTYECYFTQKAQTTNKTVSVENFQSDPVPSWLELPEVTTDSQLYYITHDMTHNGQTVRNYSFLYDIENHVALWVAYPLNKSLIGSGSRHFSGTSYWVGTVDPKVPRDYQSVTETVFRGYSNINRGHQIPSADRLNSDANFQTFYGTNMTPQDAGLNSGGWATLEGMVRSWANTLDTLYVVTGADIEGSTGYALDNDGKKVTVPVGYFKALLGYKKSGTIGITATTGGYTGIAFYLSQSDNGNMGSSEVMNRSMTIDALEEKLGYDFFPGLASKTSYSEYVEATSDNWWKQ